MPDPKDQFQDIYGRLMEAISAQESGGNYEAVNESYSKSRKRKVEALGKYQVMDYNLPGWSKQYLGKQYTRGEFLASPEAQERLYQAKMGEYLSNNLKKHGDPRKAVRESALDWYGRGTPSEGPSSKVYADTIVRRFDGATGGSQQQFQQPAVQLAQRGKFQTPEEALGYIESITQPGQIPNGSTVGSTPETPVDPRLLEAIGGPQITSIAGPASEEPVVEEVPQTASGGAQGFVRPPRRRSPQVASGSAQGAVVMPPTRAQRAVQAGVGTVGQQPTFARVDTPPAGDPLIAESTGAPQKPIRDIKKAAIKKEAQQAIKSGQIEAGDVQISEGGVTDTDTESLERLGYRNQYRGLQRVPRKKGQFYNDATGEWETDPVISELEYVQQKERTAVRDSLKKQGLTGKVLAAAINPKVGDVGDDLATLGGMDLANALSGYALEAISPKAFSDATGELGKDKGEGAVVLARGSAGLGGALLGIKGVGKFTKALAKSAPIVNTISPTARFAAEATLAQAPGDVIAVAQGDKTPEAALGEAALTALQFGSITPTIKAAKQIGKELGKTAATERLIAESANIAGQVGVGSAAEFLQTENVSPEGALLNVALSYGDPVRYVEPPRRKATGNKSLPVEPGVQASPITIESIAQAIPEARAALVDLPEHGPQIRVATTAIADNAAKKQAAKKLESMGFEKISDEYFAKSIESQDPNLGMPRRETSQKMAEAVREEVRQEPTTTSEQVVEARPAEARAEDVPPVATVEEISRPVEPSPSEAVGAEVPAEAPARIDTDRRKEILAALPVNAGSPSRAILDYAIRNRIQYEGKSWMSAWNAIEADALKKAGYGAEAASAAVGAMRLESPRDTGGIREAPPTRQAEAATIPKFKNGQRVYTYDVARDANDNPFVPDTAPEVRGRVITKTIAKRDADGNVVKEKYKTTDGKTATRTVMEDVQFIKTEGGLRPVDEFTALQGRPHPLTHPVDAAPMSNFFAETLSKEIAGTIDADINYRISDRMKSRARFTANVDGPRIQMDVAFQPGPFVDPNRSSADIKHDIIGHVLDYVGEPPTLKRGNVLGHLFALKDFGEETFKGLSDNTLRNELTNLSSKYKPLPENPATDYLEYRFSPSELIADGVSAMLNDPAFVKREAPAFYESFNRMIESRPAVKESFDLMHGLMNNDPDAIGRMAREVSDIEGMKDPEVRRARMAGDEETAMKLSKREGDWNKFVRKFGSTTKMLEALGGKLTRDADKTLSKAGLRGLQFKGKSHRKGLTEYERYIDAVDAGTGDEFLTQFNQKQQDALRIAYRKMGGYRSVADVRLWGEALHRKTSMQEGLVHDISSDEIARLTAAGLTDLDAKSYIESTALAGPYREEAMAELSEQSSREGLANPHFKDAGVAKAQLEYDRKTLGEEKFKVLEEVVSSARERQFALMEEADALGMISPELMETVRLNRKTYGRFAALEYAGSSIGLSRKEARGFLGEASNTWTNTLMQMVDIKGKMIQQRAALATKRAMLEERPDAFRPREEGERINEAYEGTVSIWEGGKLKEYVTDKAIANAFKSSPESADVLEGLANSIRGIQRGLFITYNPLFPTRNVPKDVTNFAKTMGFAALPRFAKTMKESYRTQMNRYSPIAKEALGEGAIRLYNTSMRDERAVTPGKLLLSEAGIVKPPERSRGKRALDMAKKIAQNVPPFQIIPKDIQETLEANAKFAGYKIMRERGFKPEEAAYWSSKLGTPDTRVRGEHTKTLNNIFLFSNVGIQGHRRNMEFLANPATRTSYAMRSLFMGVGLKLPQWLIKYGPAYMLAKEMYGEGSEEANAVLDMERAYQKFSTDDLSRYYVAFTGREGDEVQGIPYPVEEMDVALGAFVEPLIKAAAGDTDNFSDFLSSYMAAAKAQLPSVAPVGKVAHDFAQYMMFGNWYDDYRQKYGLPAGKEKIAKDDRFDPIAMNEFAFHAFNSIFGTTLRSGVNTVRRMAGDETVSKRYPFFIQTKGGTYEKEREAKIQDDADAERTRIFKRELRDKIRSGDRRAAARARRAGFINEREQKAIERDSKISEDERKLKYTSAPTLIRRKKLYESIGDTKRADELEETLEEREK